MIQRSLAALESQISGEISNKASVFQVSTGILCFLKEGNRQALPAAAEKKTSVCAHTHTHTRSPCDSLIGCMCVCVCVCVCLCVCMCVCEGN